MGPSMPGIQTGLTYGANEFMYIPHTMVMLPGPQKMSSAGYDGSYTSREWQIRAGWILGKITASGELVPCKRTRANGAGSASLSLTVDNAAAFKAADSLVIGSTTGVISSINYTTNVITLTATKTWSDNDNVYVDDGSDKAFCISAGFVSLKTDDNITAVDKPVGCVVGGWVDTTRLYGDLESILLDATSVIQLSGFNFYPIPTAQTAAFTNLSASGTLTVTGAATLSSTLAVTTSVTTPIVIMTGTTGNQEIRLTTNLADALSVEDTAGDLIVFDTTTGAQIITITPKLKLASDLHMLGTTGTHDWELTDNVADALSLKITAGADLLVVTTTTTGGPYFTFGAGVMDVTQSVTPAADSGTGSTIKNGIKQVAVAAVTNDANDWITLPAIASHPIGHTIRIACNAGGNFELRTPASSNTKINDVDSDGSQEYLCTDTDVVIVTKATTTGWVAQSLTKLGAVRTAVIPDA